MTSTKRTIRRRKSQYLGVTIFSIGLAFGSAPVATAEWDIEAYDKCVSNIGSGNILAPTQVIECCIDSGGVPVTPHIDNPLTGCAAPPANEAMTGEPAPPRSPQDIVGGPVRDFNVPDANVPDAPVIVLPTP